METAIVEESIEDNVLEGGEQAVVINADAADNLEVGLQAAVIQAVSNDNEVVEEYSQELDFAIQPPSQYQPKTELQKLREEYESFKDYEREQQAIQSRRNTDAEHKLDANVLELRKEINVEASLSITRHDALRKIMSERAQSLNDRLDELDMRL